MSQPRDTRPSSRARGPVKAAVMAEVLALMKPEPLMASATSDASKAALVEAYREVGDLELAAAVCELSLETVQGMMRSDTSFRERLTVAKAAWAGSLVRSIITASQGPKGDHRAATWLLERLERDKFAPPTQTTKSTVTVDVALMSEQELLEAAGIVDTTGEAVLLSRHGQTQED